MRLDDLGRLAPCALIATDTEGVIRQANDTFLEWVGRSRDEVVGTPFVSFLDGGSQIFYETRQASVLQLEGGVRGVALNLVDATGSSRAVLIDSVVRDVHDQRVTLTALLDATERHEYERQLLDARRSEERASKRVRVLQESATAFATAITETDVGDALVESARDAFDALHVAVHMIEPDRSLPLLAGHNPLSEFYPPDAPRVGIVSLTERRVIVIKDVAEADAINPLLGHAFRAAGVSAMTVAPILDDTRPLGVMDCFFGRPREFDDDGIALKTALTNQAAQTLLRVQMQEAMRLMGLRDHVTGLPGRQALEDQLAGSIISSRETGKPMAVIFVDLDGFKAVNDTLGHAFGDTVLAEVAHRLRRAVRGEDVVSRYGGDEFIAVCDQCDEFDALVIAERLRTAVAEPIDGVPTELHVTASVGVALVKSPEEAHTTEVIIALADQAMYSAKTSGRNRIEMLRVPAAAAG
jgi:diguanylate cyclase (GGDEF)-like protein/PAS domain S-box-containing protein